MSDPEQLQPSNPSPKGPGEDPSDPITRQPDATQPELVPGKHPSTGIEIEINPPGDPLSTPVRQLELLKGGHRYVFRYTPGQEARILDDLMAMGSDPNSPLTMFDAAVLSHQLGQRMGRRFEQLLKT